MTTTGLDAATDGADMTVDEKRNLMKTKKKKNTLKPFHTQTLTELSGQNRTAPHKY